MTILDQIKEYFELLDTKTFRYYVLGLCSFLILASGFLIYRYYSNINALKKRIISINKKREEVKEILERYEIVKIQQAEVDALLAQDKTFKIGQYFNDVINKLGLAQNKTREPETSSEELDNGYTEIKLYASFSNMNTKKLTDLLDTLEQNDRIYTKDIEAYKPNAGQTINVNILIATLEPKIETAEITE